MTSLVRKLTAYFRGKYAPEQTEALEAFAMDIDDKDQERCYSWIIENREKMTPVGVADIKKAAVALGVGFRRNTLVTEVVPVECPACETSYKYYQAATEYSMLEMHQHARCPQCGMPGHDIFLAREYRAACANQWPEWWERTLDWYRRGGKEGRGGWMRPGPWYQPGEIRAEMSAEKRRNAERMVEQLAEEKSWSAFESRDGQR